MPRGGRREGAGRKPDAAKLEKRADREVLTRAAAEDARATMQQAETNGEPLAKTVLNKYMQLFDRLAALYRPSSHPVVDEHSGKPIRASMAKFEKYSRLALDCAKQLAPYQSATFRAVLVTPPAPAAEPGAEQPSAQILDFPINDPLTAARVYRHVMAGGAA